ncbi:mitochondrial ATPase inhibitor, IATP-domain-containing protein [Lasiosphaeris hirsuta]|uniref:ATPase inhibitor, mitochondrial n=1 Tax=Lasiosphaeris hirsuta TaxID=260670 RepID=A0AA40BCM7_9PEZI|nr:mitochondrial ATPase inhibitor, IATP-domain-containing protein [Lasiosphaeris hirsuta]
MFRTAITKAARPSRVFSTARIMLAGETGSPPKTGGQGDAFQRRERANEDFAIRKIEQEKLKALRDKLRQQQAHIKELSDHIDELTKEQGGEHN